MSKLTASQLVDAIVVLRRVADLEYSVDPAQLGRLRADAFIALNTLQACGLSGITVEVRSDKEAA